MPGLGLYVIAALTILGVWSKPSIAGELPFGKDISSADRTLVAKLLGPDTTSEIDVTRDLNIAKVDLNGDGTGDYVVIVTNSLYCGSHGCAASVYVSEGGRYRRVADMLAHDVALGDGSTKGVRDLLQGGTTRWVWDGGKYRQVLPGSAK
jgi:hypothetical protein